MSVEAPALIQYACERCKTRFVLPASSRKLSLGGRFRAMGMSFGRVFKHHEGFGSAFDTTKRQMLAKMDDEAYQAFVQSFRFCHECRQFVCNECWSTSRRSCLTCVAKSMAGEVRPRPPFAPAGPEIPRPVAVARPRRTRQLRRDATIVAMVVAVALLAVEGGMLLIYAASPSPTAPVLYVTPTPAASATATPTTEPTIAPTPTAVAVETPTETPTATATATPAPTPTPTPTATPTAAATPTKAPTPRPTRAPTPSPKPTLPSLPRPVVACANQAGTFYVCTVTNAGNYTGGSFTWYQDGASVGGGTEHQYPIDGTAHSIKLVVNDPGYVVPVWTGTDPAS